MENTNKQAEQILILILGILIGNFLLYSIPYVFGSYINLIEVNIWFIIITTNIIVPSIGLYIFNKF